MTCCGRNTDKLKVILIQCGIYILYSLKGDQQNLREVTVVLAARDSLRCKKKLIKFGR